MAKTINWRLANSLVTLRDQINALAPKRSKASDGTIGDAAHSSRTSDHNPDAGGVVRGMDITHDPANGVDSQRLAEALLTSRDSRLKYVISNGRIASGRNGPQPWTWRPYSGTNPHNHHVHISVVAGAPGDDAGPWNVELSIRPVATAAPVKPLLKRGSTGKDVALLQDQLNAAGFKLAIDGDFGKATEDAVRAFQKRAGLVVDGRAGPYTWAALAAPPRPAAQASVALPFLALPTVQKETVVNTNAVHNILNVTSAVVAGATAALLATGCASTAGGGLDCTASWIDPIYTTSAVAVMQILKTGINLWRDGFAGLYKPQPKIR